MVKLTKMHSRIVRSDVSEACEDRSSKHGKIFSILSRDAVNPPVFRTRVLGMKIT